MFKIKGLRSKVEYPMAKWCVSHLIEQSHFGPDDLEMGHSMLGIEPSSSSVLMCYDQLWLTVAEVSNLSSSISSPPPAPCPCVPVSPSRIGGNPRWFPPAMRPG